MPRVRPRHGQVSTLDMPECPLSATPLREASQGHVKTARTDSVQAIVRPLIANRLPPTAELEILTKQPPFFHSPTRTIPRSVTVHTTVRHRGYHSDGSWCTPSGACPGRGCRIVGAGMRKKEKTCHYLRPAGVGASGLAGEPGAAKTKGRSYRNR